MQTLPMLGQTHGNRSAVTCHLKCDSACAHPAPNTSDAPSFRDVASTQLNRRTLLRLSATRMADPVIAEPPDLLIAPRLGLTNALQFGRVGPVAANFVSCCLYMFAYEFMFRGLLLFACLAVPAPQVPAFLCRNFSHLQFVT